MTGQACFRLFYLRCGLSIQTIFCAGYAISHISVYHYKPPYLARKCILHDTALCSFLPSTLLFNWTVLYLPLLLFLSFFFIICSCRCAILNSSHITSTFLTGNLFTTAVSVSHFYGPCPHPTWHTQLRPFVANRHQTRSSIRIPRFRILLSEMLQKQSPLNITVYFSRPFYHISHGDNKLNGANFASTSQVRTSVM